MLLVTTYTYDVISTLQDPCHRRHRRRRWRKERPRRGPPVWREGMRLSLGWLKPPVPRSSDTTVVPAILREYGKVTSPSPGPGGGGVPPPCERRERELSGRPPRRSSSNWFGGNSILYLVLNESTINTFHLGNLRKCQFSNGGNTSSRQINPFFTEKQL
jgi:hypothetical protein